MSDSFINVSVQKTTGRLSREKWEGADEFMSLMQSWLDGEPVWPLDKILSRWGELMPYRLAWHRGMEQQYNTSLYEHRQKAIERFGFAIPCQELLDALERHQPIVEIGAGSGYLTELMRKRGIEVIGTDPRLEKFGFVTGRYDKSQLVLQGKTAVRRYPSHTVFCSWPSLQKTWLRQALRAMRVKQKVILIEEDACAEETTWAYRDHAFKELEEMMWLPAWPFCNDHASVWVKNRAMTGKWLP